MEAPAKSNWCLDLIPPWWKKMMDITGRNLFRSVHVGQNSWFLITESLSEWATQIRVFIYMPVLDWFKVWSLSPATLRHLATPQWIICLNTWLSDWLWRSWEEMLKPVLLMWRQHLRNSTPSTYLLLQTSSPWVHTGKRHTPTNNRINNKKESQIVTNI